MNCKWPFSIANGWFTIGYEELQLLTHHGYVAVEGPARLTVLRPLCRRLPRAQTCINGISMGYTWDININGIYMVMEYQRFLDMVYEIKPKNPHMHTNAYYV